MWIMLASHSSTFSLELSKTASLDASRSTLSLAAPTREQLLPYYTKYSNTSHLHTFPHTCTAVHHVSHPPHLHPLETRLQHSSGQQTQSLD